MVFWHHVFTADINEIYVLALQYDIFTGDLHGILRSSIPDLHFHHGYIMNSVFWHSGIEFSFGIFTEFCVLALQVYVFTAYL